MAEQLLSALLMERQRQGLPTVLDMARQAAFRMAPKPGRVVLSAVLSITASVEVDVGLEAVEEVAHTILQVSEFTPGFLRRQIHRVIASLDDLLLWIQECSAQGIRMVKACKGQERIAGNPSEDNQC